MEGRIKRGRRKVGGGDEEEEVRRRCYRSLPSHGLGH